jgi:O-antigen ligase
LAWAAVFASFARALYVSTLVGMIVVLITAAPKERLRGLIRTGLTFGLGIILLIPVFFSVRIFHLLIEHYALRLLSSQHIQSDLSLRMRYLEWQSELEAIKDLPFFGHGFGSAFRFLTIEGYHMWQAFSHSSYLYLLFKTGVIGSIFFWGSYVAFGLLGLKLVRDSNLSIRSRIAVRAGFGYIVLIVFYSYAAPVLDSKTDLIWIGLIWGIFLALEKNRTSSESYHGRIPPVSSLIYDAA